MYIFQTCSRRCGSSLVPEEAPSTPQEVRYFQVESEHPTGADTDLYACYMEGGKAHTFALPGRSTCKKKTKKNKKNKDPHIQTFDGLIHHSQGGTCAYDYVTQCPDDYNSNGLPDPSSLPFLVSITYDVDCGTGNAFLTCVKHSVVRLYHSNGDSSHYVLLDGSQTSVKASQDDAFGEELTLVGGQSYDFDYGNFQVICVTLARLVKVWACHPCTTGFKIYLNIGLLQSYRRYDGIQGIHNQKWLFPARQFQ